MPSVPDVEFMIVIQWMLLVGIFVVFTTFISTWAGQKAKELYFGKDPKRRKQDSDNNEWVERFLEGQANFTDATVGLTKELQEIKSSLKNLCQFQPKGVTSYGK